MYHKINCRMKMMEMVKKMTTDTTQNVYTTKPSPVETRDGFQEQVILLTRLSEKLDEYFSQHSLNK